MESSLLKDEAERRYAAALQREEALREFWLGQGSPMTAIGGSTGKLEVPHPLLYEMRMAEAHSSRMAKALEASRRRPGRPATIEPDERPGLLTRVK